MIIMARKAYLLYLDGEPYTTLKSAHEAARVFLGRPVSREALLEAADCRKPLKGLAGPLTVSWKPPRKKPAPKKPDVLSASPAPVPPAVPSAVPSPPRAALLRYPPGTGPLYDGGAWRQYV
jgi:hypothetical protein